ncbi:hypothetical protein ACVWYQ_002608 [Bradyrhizobium sp. USDA 3397]
MIIYDNKIIVCFAFLRTQGRCAGYRARNNDGGSWLRATL